MIRMIRDFLMWRKILNELDVAKMSPALKHKLKNENPETEKELNDLLLNNLARRVIRDGVGSEFSQGFKSALMLRVAIKSSKFNEE